MTGTWQPRFHQPDPIELATFMVTGMSDRPDLVAQYNEQLTRSDTARSVLEDFVLRGLQKPPLVIAFSGGRDSSALLAVSAHVARREGLPMPIAFTFRYDGEAEADETAWQELVIKHLNVSDWERAHVGTRHDVIGELAQEFLMKHGLVFPPTLFNNTLPLIRARGGTHMSGEGGDEIFGVRRATILRRILDNPKYLLDKQHLRHAALCFGPRPFRVAAWRYDLERRLSGIDFVKPEVSEQQRRDLAAHVTSEPFNLMRSMGWHLRRKMIVMFEEGQAAIAQEHDVQHLDPFLEPKLVAAYARMVKPFGLAGRTDAMRVLFADLLPDEVLTRTSKAIFNRGFLTDVGREFARSWQGQGVDTDIVDVDALRAAWLADWPPSQSFGLLQAAWLHEKQSASRGAP